VTFSQTTSIKTVLIDNRDDYALRSPTYIVTFGISAAVASNPVCVALAKITDGGWYFCPTSMIGKVFGMYSNNDYLNFMEAMAYTQEAIQMNAGVTVSFIGTNDLTYPASNAI
jgi:hypothetical protein